MKVTVEITLYPLKDAYLEPIRAFIDRLNAHEGIEVDTGPTATLVVGDYGRVLDVLCDEMRVTHERVPHAAFVVKVLGGDVRR